MIVNTSSILPLAMRSTGLFPPMSRWGLNNQIRASSGSYTWPSWSASHSSRRSRARLFGRGADLPVRQRDTVCGVVSRSCATSRAEMPPVCLMPVELSTYGCFHGCPCFIARQVRCAEHVNVNQPETGFGPPLVKWRTPETFPRERRWAMDTPILWQQLLQRRERSILEHGYPANA